MGTCFFDDCKKKEWLKRRKLRLQQVQSQSRDIAQEVRERVSSEKKKREMEWESMKEEGLARWKKEELKVLEERYREAMEKVGLGHSVAQAQPDMVAVMKEVTSRDRAKAAERGRSAIRKRVEEGEEAVERAAAPVRRRIVTRHIEDIRAALVVQARDCEVIRNAGRETLVKIPPLAANDSERNKMASETTDAVNGCPQISHRSGLRFSTELKSPSATGSLSRATSLGLPSAGCSARQRKPITASPQPRLRNRDQTSVANQPKDVESSPSRPQSSRFNSSKEYPTLRSDHGSDDEDSLISKYLSSPQKRKIEEKNSARGQLLRAGRSKKSKCDVLKTVDRAIEEGRRMRLSAELSSDTSDEDTVKVVVNVNCIGVDSGTQLPASSSNTAATQTCESRAVGTATGHSLNDSCCNGPCTCVHHYVHVLPRSSTVEDISLQAQVDDLSSISFRSEQHLPNIPETKDGDRVTGGSSAAAVRVSNADDWSSTAYLSPPASGKEIELNPALVFYIRKLLGMSPLRTSKNSSILPDVNGSEAEQGENRELEVESEECQKRIQEIQRILQQVREDAKRLSSSSSGGYQMSSTSGQPNTNREICGLVESGSSSNSLPDVMDDLMRRNLISSPFCWSRGHSLSITDSEVSPSKDLDEMLTKLGMDWARPVMRRYPETDTS